MRITDRNLIKLIEIHTISSSEAWVYKPFNLLSVSRNHYARLSLAGLGRISNKYRGNYSILLSSGLLSAYWKAHKYIEILEDDKKRVLNVVTDYGVGSLRQTLSNIPAPPLSRPDVDGSDILKLHRLKNAVAKVVKTRNYKYPKPIEKYVVLRMRNEMRLVKSSIFLQSLECAWRLNKYGVFRINEDCVYFSTVDKRRKLFYEAFVMCIGDVNEFVDVHGRGNNTLVPVVDVQLFRKGK